MNAPAAPGGFSTIIVGIDGEQGGRDAAALAQRLAGDGTTIVLVHRHHPHGDAEQAGEIVRRARELIDGDVVLVDRAAHSVAKLLHEVAAEQRADLIVAGSPAPRDHRASLAADLPSIVHHSPCSVAVAPRGYADAPAPIDSIGAGFRETPPAHLAVTVAQHLGERFGVSVHALSVVQQTPSPWRGPALGTLDAMQAISGSAEHELRETLATFPALDVVIETGNPVEHLLDFAERCDLLVIGAPARGALRRLVVGSAAHGLMGKTPCPLLIVGGEHLPAIT